MTRLDLNAGLDEIVAARFLAPAVDRAKDAVQAAARRRAPDGATWVTAHDERVRPAHADADGQTIPDNLRFRIVDTKGYMPSGRRETHTPPAPPAVHLMRAPRDRSAPIHLTANCRCVKVAVPQAVARTILAGPTVVLGTIARAEVSTSFPRAAESEYGTGQDRAAAFMRGAVNEVAARGRGRASGT
jgi:hypothetical protein